MTNLPPLALLTSGLLLCCVVAPLAAQSCTSCGPECVSACGSRRYRTCCFNYLRKRRSPAAPGMPASEMAEAGGAGGGVASASGALLDGLPDDLRLQGLQLFVVPSDHLDQDGQDQYSSLALLHHILDAQSGDAVDGTGTAEAITSAPVAAPAPAHPSATLQRRRTAGGAGAGAGGRGWLSDLHRRTGLFDNV